MTTATTTATAVVETFWALYTDPTSTERAWRAERKDVAADVERYRGMAAKLTDYGDYQAADYYCDQATEAQEILDAIDARYDGLV